MGSSTTLRFLFVVVGSAWFSGTTSIELDESPNTKGRRFQDFLVSILIDYHPVSLRTPISFLPR